MTLCCDVKPSPHSVKYAQEPPPPLSFQLTANKAISIHLPCLMSLLGFGFEVHFNDTEYHPVLFCSTERDVAHVHSFGGKRKKEGKEGMEVRTEKKNREGKSHLRVAAVTLTLSGGLTDPSVKCCGAAG